MNTNTLLKHSFLIINEELCDDELTFEHLKTISTKLKKITKQTEEDIEDFFKNIILNELISRKIKIMLPWNNPKEIINLIDTAKLGINEDCSELNIYLFSPESINKITNIEDKKLFIFIYNIVMNNLPMPLDLQSKYLYYQIDDQLKNEILETIQMHLRHVRLTIMDIKLILLTSCALSNKESTFNLSMYIKSLVHTEFLRQRTLQQLLKYAPKDIIDVYNFFQ